MFVLACNAIPATYSLSTFSAETLLSLDIANTKAPEPTLEEARADLAKAVGNIADQFLAKRYGPLIGTIAETTTIATLQQFEANLTRAKGDVTLVVQEFSDRIFSTGKLRRE